MLLHHQFDPLVPPVDPLPAGSLFSLKRERVQIGTLLTVMVDAVFFTEDQFIAIPFMRPIERGAVAFPRAAASIGEGTAAWLERQVLQWLQGVNLDEAAMTLFSQHDALAAIVNQSAGGSAFPGLSPYSRIFTDGERYANAGVWIHGKRVLDAAPGYGFGAMTLRALSSAIATDREALKPGGERISGMVPAVEARAFGAEAVLALGLDAASAASRLESLRAAHPRARLVVSSYADEGRDALAAAGLSPIPMTRPGAEIIGPLHESLAVLDAEPRVFSGADVSPAHHEPAQVSNRPLRVQFVVRPSARKLFGGDLVQIRETASALQRRGHDVDLCFEERPQSDGFDIVHLTNLTTPETLDQSRAVGAFSGPVVMMPIFTDHSDETAWGMQATLRAYSNSETEEDLQKHLEQMARRELAVEGFPPPPQRAELVKGYTDMQRSMLENVDFLIANAHSEMHRLYRYLTYEIPYAIAPSAANPATYGTFRRDAFVAKYGLQDYILVAGRYEPRKGQLPMFELARVLEMPVVSIGACYEHGMAYLDRAYRPGNVVCLPHMPEIELAGAFAAARVLAMPSWDEVVSLTSLNGALSEASLVLTRNSSEHEYFGADAFYCDPGDITSIRRAIEYAWETHGERSGVRAALSQRVLRDYNWDRSAETTEAAYYRVLAFNPRGDRRRARLANTG